MRQRLWNLLAGFCGSLGSSWGKATTLEYCAGDFFVVLEGADWTHVIKRCFNVAGIAVAREVVVAAIRNGNGR